MRVVTLGGGPAGLYLGILLKKAFPEVEVTIHERNRPDDTFGFGVVFSDETLDFLVEADAESFEEIRSRFRNWTDIRTFHGGECDDLDGTRILRPGAGRSARDSAAPGARVGLRPPFRERRDRRRGASRRRPRRGGRRSQQRGARALRARARSPSRARELPVLLARHRPAPRRLHLPVRRYASRSVPGPRLPLRRRAGDVHRRDPRGDLAGRRTRPRRRSRHGGDLREAVRRAPPRSPAGHQPLDLAPVPHRHAASAGTTATSCCSATPPTPRTSRSARAPSSRWRTPSRWSRRSAGWAPATSRGCSRPTRRRGGPTSRDCSVRRGRARGAGSRTHAATGGSRPGSSAST